MGTYDWMSLKWAAQIALAGGALRTILDLASDGGIVWGILRQGLRDAFVSLIAGMAAFVAIEAYRATGMGIPSEVRFAAILAAGVMRKKTFVYIGFAGRDWMASIKAAFVRMTTKDPATKDPAGGS
jgi:hypothetical protein